MENTAIIIKAHLIYLPLALTMTIVVARQLFKNSKVFMLDIFHGRESIAFATNRLFEIGFYLMNCGFALLLLPAYNSYSLQGNQDLIELLSAKLGGFSIYLGFMLFLNLVLFFRGRKKSNEKNQVSIQGV